MGRPGGADRVCGYQGMLAPLSSVLSSHILEGACNCVEGFGNKIGLKRSLDALLTCSQAKRKDFADWVRNRGTEHET